VERRMEVCEVDSRDELRRADDFYYSRIKNGESQKGGKKEKNVTLSTLMPLKNAVFSK
jgi:hypothetical protein